MQKFTIGQENSKKRLDVFLVDALKKFYSRSAIKNAIDGGFTLVNNKERKAGYKLRIGDSVTFIPPPEKKCEVVPEDIPIDIVYEDKDIVIANKPAGMVVHPGSGNYDGTLVNALLFYCNGMLSSIGSPLRPGIVHRLDKGVSGIIVLAKTDNAYYGLIKQFKQRSIKRNYIAFAKGKFHLKAGRITVPIGRSIKDRKKMAVTSSGKGGKDAITYYKVLKQFDEFAKLSISLGTGRTHQIRVHTSYIGHPILGDTRYGGPWMLKSGRRLTRLMLHALSLELKHPTEGNALFFQTQLPREFAELEQDYIQI